jgi:hypothetical protein
MASIICRNGTDHQHTSVLDSKICWGIVRPPAPPAPVVPLTWRERPATESQIKYIKSLGGDEARARRMTGLQASDEIDRLKRNPRPMTPVQPERDSRTKMIVGLIDSVPSGYFAVQEADGRPVTFMRISRPKHGNFKDAIKVQTQHGPEFKDAWAYWPATDKLMHIRGPWGDVSPQLLMLIADWQGSTMRYSRLIGKCGRCNLALTDDRSRYYGIGPDCEQVWPWFIDEVDEIKGPYRR